MAAPRIVLTIHAEDMLNERGIDRSWVAETIRDPEIVESDPQQANVFRAFRRIPER
jgi:hypothetical protein